MAMKQARPPPKKKSKGKGKAAVTEPSDADESQVGDVLSEVKIHPLLTRHSLLTVLYLRLCNFLCRMKKMKARKTP